MTDMVERVARALAREDLCCSDADVSKCADDESDPIWTFYTVEARTAIEAMREPTPEMLAEIPENYQAWAMIWWRTMIDATLKETDG